MGIDIHTYIFFKSNNDTIFLIDSLSFTLLIPSLDVIEINETMARKHFRKCFLDEPINEPFNSWLWPYIKDREAFTILGIKKSLLSDQKLIDIFSDNYVGVADVRIFSDIKECIAKDQLFDTANLLRNF